eukprot:3000790-Amphidinium_carterae.1
MGLFSATFQDVVTSSRLPAASLCCSWARVIVFHVRAVHPAATWPLPHSIQVKDAASLSCLFTKGTSGAQTRARTLDNVKSQDALSLTVQAAGNDTTMLSDFTVCQ